MPKDLSGFYHLTVGRHSIFNTWSHMWALCQVSFATAAMPGGPAMRATGYDKLASYKRRAIAIAALVSLLAQELLRQPVGDQPVRL